MADISWVRLYVDMFNHKKIKYIRRLPDGNDILLCWIMLIASCGKCNAGGYIFLTENMPYTPDDLADEFGLPVNTVRLALKTFENLGMIEVDEKGIYILGWEEHQNVDGLERIREMTRKRVSKHRERNRLTDPIFVRDNNTCQYCGAKATGHDHVIATANGGNESESNKVACCIECNRIKNNHPLEKFLNENRDRISDDLIKENLILSSYVTLCNVTDRYVVTHGNATDIDLDKDKEIDSNNIRRNKFADDSIPYQLAKYLQTVILNRDPKTKTPKDLQNWAAEADRMLRLDKREAKESAQLMQWAQKDPFWCANILSMKKFREKYDQLKRQAVSGGQQSKAKEQPIDRMLREAGVSWDG